MHVRCITGAHGYDGTSREGATRRSLTMFRPLRWQCVSRPMLRWFTSRLLSDLGEPTDMNNTGQVNVFNRTGNKKPRWYKSFSGSERQVNSVTAVTNTLSSFAALLQINSLQIPDSFDVLPQPSPTHGVANNVERYSVKPGPRVRASRPPTQSVASKWPIPPTYPSRSRDIATSVSWHVAACAVDSVGVVILPSYHDKSCPPVYCLMKIMSTRAVPRPTATGQRRIVVFQIKCGTIPQQRRPPCHAHAF